MATPKVKELNPNLQSLTAMNFEKQLRNRIVGQDEAIRILADTYQIYLAGLNEVGKPVANLLFLGPTGSGKTHIVEAVADILFKNERAIVKVDCAEYQHSQEVARLIGSPPGYLGWKETVPVFAQANLNRFHTETCKLSLVLLDEIEKANEALWQIMLGIGDKATLTMGDGAVTDFTSSVICYTSNVGARELSNAVMEGFGFSQAGGIVDTKKLSDIATAAAKKKFSPEFMNRIDKMCVFNTLTRAHMDSIIEIELGRIQQRILKSNAKKFLFRCEAEVKKMLADEGYSAEYNARNLNRVLKQKLINPFATMLSSGQINQGDFIEIQKNGDGFRFIRKAAGISLDGKVLEKAIAAN